MAYEKFLIADFKTGKFTGKDPWLSPKDAFPTIINARINKAVLEKRLGFSPFATMKHGAVEQSTTSVMGIGQFFRKGLPKLLIIDTLRPNLYDAVNSSMSDISGGSNLFTGDNGDFFSFQNWQNVLYFVNNKDPIYKYDGSGNVSIFNVQFASGDPNQLNTCRFIFEKDDRLLLLDTVENGTWQPQRLRYSAVLQTSFSASGAGYVDAPTSGRVVVAGYVGNDIAVWFENPSVLYRIRSYGDTDTPFEWKKFRDSSDLGTSKTPYVGVRFNDGIATIGPEHIIFFNGYTLKAIDIPNVRDVIDDFKSSNIRQCFGYVQDEKRRVQITYTSTGGTNPDRLLELNVNEGNWTVHKSEQSFFVHCLGGFSGQKVPVMTDVDIVVGSAGDDVSTIAIDSREVLGDPAQFTLIGCRNSQVYKWEDGAFDGTDDANGNINLDIRFGRMNPYIKEGKKVRLGKVQFLVDRDSTAIFLASLFKDAGDIDADTAYKTLTITCSGTANKDKVWLTLHADGNIGNFHQLQISHTARSNRPRIHAIQLFMQRAGHLDL